jgi:hypothetical protein
MAYLFFCSLFLGAVLSYLYNPTTAASYYTENCTATMIIYNKDIRADLIFEFMFFPNAKNGVITVSGNLSKDNTYQGAISRNVSFNWMENDHTYNLVSTRIQKARNMETLTEGLIANILPEFFTAPDRHLYFTVAAYSTARLLIGSGNSPLFFCPRQ